MVRCETNTSERTDISCFSFVGQILPYSDGVLAEEIIILVLLLAAESLRMHFGKLSESSARTHGD